MLILNLYHSEFLRLKKSSKALAQKTTPLLKNLWSCGLVVFFHIFVNKYSCL